jgi:hypothetical protein
VVDILVLVLNIYIFSFTGNQLLIHIVRILSFNSTEHVEVKGKTKTEPEIAIFFC